MGKYKGGQIERILGIYTKLINGYIIYKAQEAERYGVNERTIQRDIDEIRNHLENEAEDAGFINSIVYDRIKKGYRLEQIYKMKLTNSEVLAVCKILLDSRAFTKEEIIGMLDRLVTCCVTKSNQRLVMDLIKNEKYHYVEPRHKKVFIDDMWTIGQAIRECHFLEIDYKRAKDKVVVKRKVKPVAIIFSEYYFYLTAFIDGEEIKQYFDVINDSFPTIYRIDRIEKLKVLDDRFHIPYSSRFEEGEFRKRIQFMYGGKLRTVKFNYLGTDVNAVLDRLPTAEVLEETDGIYTISAEVFGKGIDMWLRSQGEMVKVIEIKDKTVQ